MKNCVITGAARGIGREMALALARQRARIVLADIRPEAGESTAEEVRRAGGEALLVSCDVTDGGQVDSLGQRARLWFHERSAGARPGVDLLVNNAGVLVAGELVEVSIEDHRRVFDVNYWGVLHGCRAFAAGMIEEGGGAILNVASLAGALSPPRMGAYNATKAAVIALSETLAAELRPKGVTVTLLCPSFTAGTALIDDASGDSATMALGMRALRLVGASPREVAEVGLAAANRGELYAMVGLQGRLAWWSKRAAPAVVTRGLALANRLL